MSRKEYFAYGSNLNFEQMAYRCPEAAVVGIAKLDGYELAFRRGYLTNLPKEDASVEGLIWSITDHDGHGCRRRTARNHGLHHERTVPRPVAPGQQPLQCGCFAGVSGCGHLSAAVL